MKRPLRAIPVIALLLLLLGCDAASPVVRVRNEPGQWLSEVEIFGRGFNRHVGDLPDAEETLVKVAPGGESGVGVRFKIDGKRHELPESGYFENNRAYRVSIVITRKLTSDAGEARPVLLFNVGDIQVARHFFSEREIEFDFLSNSIRTEADLAEALHRAYRIGEASHSLVKPKGRHFVQSRNVVAKTPRWPS